MSGKMYFRLLYAYISTSVSLYLTKDTSLVLTGLLSMPMQRKGCTPLFNMLIKGAYLCNTTKATALLTLESHGMLFWHCAAGKSWKVQFCTTPVDLQIGFVQ